MFKRLCVAVVGIGLFAAAAMPAFSQGTLRIGMTAADIPLTTEDIEHLHKGYAGLIYLMERIPTRWAWAAEPPHVFRADE